jgi:putative flippase GtrA
MPELSLPFAIVGGLGGFLSCGVLVNPLIDATRAEDQPIAAVITALIGAVLGYFLSRRFAPRDDFSPEGATRVRLFFAVLIAACASGAFVGLVCAPAPDRAMYGVITGALDGVVFGVALFPVCAFVLTAARRAARARNGSLVARADARATWSMLVAALGASTILSVPDWPAAIEGSRPAPYIALVTAWAGVAVVALLALLDVLALLEIARIARGVATMERREQSDATEAASAPAIDLGLGADLFAKVDRGAAYRSRERATSLVTGSPRAARAELFASLRRSALELAALSMVLIAHYGASTPSLQIAYFEQRCSQGAAEACLSAADLLWERDNASPSLIDMERGFANHRAGCALGACR